MRHTLKAMTLGAMVAGMILSSPAQSAELQIFASSGPNYDTDRLEALVRRGLPATYATKYPAPGWATIASINCTDLSAQMGSYTVHCVAKLHTVKAFRGKSGTQWVASVTDGDISSMGWYISKRVTPQAALTVSGDNAIAEAIKSMLEFR